VNATAVANARVEPKGNAILVTKQASGSGKIGPLMVAFNARCADVQEPLVLATEHLCDLEGLLLMQSWWVCTRQSGRKARSCGYKATTGCSTSVFRILNS
jgi:hypothetical protein